MRIPDEKNIDREAIEKVKLCSSQSCHRVNQCKIMHIVKKKGMSKIFP